MAKRLIKSSKSIFKRLNNLWELWTQKRMYVLLASMRLFKIKRDGGERWEQA